MDIWNIVESVDLADPAVKNSVPIMGEYQDKLAHVWKITVLNNNQPAALAGYSAQARFLREDGNSVVVAATISGNTITVTFPENVYAYAGTVLCLMRLTTASATMTVCRRMMIVARGTSNNVIDPENVIDINAAVAQHDAAAGAHAALMANKLNKPSRSRFQAIYEDFIAMSVASILPFSNTSMGGSSGPIYDTADHPGVISLLSGAAANTGFHIKTPLSFLLAGGEYYEAVFKTPAVITSTALVKLGFTDESTAAAAENGAWINIAGATLSGKTYKDSAVSTTGSTHTLSAATWYRAVVKVNAAATAVEFQLYSAAGALLWSATLSTTIPTGAGHNTGAAILASNTAAGAVFLVYMDSVLVDIDRTLTR